MLLTIVAGVIVLSVLIIVHELGHFFAAKATGVWVEEFGIGFPPRLYGRKWGDTIYSINWIPFGGFNKISGEVDPKAPRALAARGYAVRLLVLSGGIITNLILPFILLSVAFMIPHDVLEGKVVIEEVASGSPAEISGLRVGDTILTVDGREVQSVGDLARFTQLRLGAEVAIDVRRADASLETVRLVPRWRYPAGQGPMGIRSRTLDPVIIRESLPFWRAVPVGARTCIETLVLSKNGITEMINGMIPFQPSGPVSIVQVAGEVAHTGISPLLELTAFISIAVAITQIIPFPALDGGRLIFLFLEWVRRGKRVSPRTEGIIHSIGFFILLALMLLVTYQDIIRWVSGESLLP
ncbi:MAG: RIP metalloprotease RseP [Chloroflexi bacterium RBG_16_56_11]|nr:MAG: RIP metalloprotease RseP [Chloroflexi bacterium RBG_16_56_11]